VVNGGRARGFHTAVIELVGLAHCQHVSEPPKMML